MIYILPNDISPAVLVPGPDVLLSNHLPKRLAKFVTVLHEWGLARRVSLIRGMSVVMPIQYAEENAWSDERYWTRN